MSQVGPAAADRVRIDKWLWAARFFKTRSLATEAVEGGKVQVNGERVKAARPLRTGDRLRIRRGPEELELVVVGLSEHRGPAAAAQALYRETDESVSRRAAMAEQQRLQSTATPQFKGRPDKKARRDYLRMTGRG